MNMKHVVFWLEYLPHNISGIIENLSEREELKVSCICAKNGYSFGRETLGWSNAHLPKVDLQVLDEIKDKDKFIESFIDTTKDAIHVYGGDRTSTISDIVEKKIFKQPQSKIIMLSERPNVYKKSFFKNFLTHIYYRYIAKTKGKRISALVAFGTKGVKEYKRIGWKDEKLFPFCYLKQQEIEYNNTPTISTPLKILYAGSFDTRKGIDILTQTFDELDAENYKLYLVGKTGNIYDKTIEWINNTEKAEYLGVWSTAELCSNLKDYDLCLVPSIAEGWGALTSEAILAGIGVITTEAAPSKDFVYSSKAGIVVKENSVKELKSAINKVLKNPQIALEWKQKAVNFRPLVDKNSVGSYFLKIIDFVTADTKTDKPQCPWLK